MAQPGVFSKEDLARQLQILAPKFMLTREEAMIFVDALFQGVATALLEGRRVRVGRLLLLELVPPRPFKVKTPTGGDWEGIRRPRLRGTALKELREAALARWASAEGKEVQSV